MKIVIKASALELNDIVVFYFFVTMTGIPYLILYPLVVKTWGLTLLGSFKWPMEKNDRKFSKPLLSSNPNNLGVFFCQISLQPSLCGIAGLPKKCS